MKDTKGQPLVNRVSNHPEKPRSNGKQIQALDLTNDTSNCNDQSSFGHELEDSDVHDSSVHENAFYESWKAVDEFYKSRMSEDGCYPSGIRENGLYEITLHDDGFSINEVQDEELSKHCISTSGISTSEIFSPNVTTRTKRKKKKRSSAAGISGTNSNAMSSERLSSSCPSIKDIVQAAQRDVPVKNKLMSSKTKVRKSNSFKENKVKHSTKMVQCKPSSKKIVPWIPSSVNPVSTPPKQVINSNKGTPMTPDSLKSTPRSVKRIGTTKNAVKSKKIFTGVAVCKSAPLCATNTTGVKNPTNGVEKPTKNTEKPRKVEKPTKKVEKSKKVEKVTAKSAAASTKPTEKSETKVVARSTKISTTQSVGKSSTKSTTKSTTRSEAKVPKPSSVNKVTSANSTSDSTIEPSKAKQKSVHKADATTPKSSLDANYKAKKLPLPLIMTPENSSESKPLRLPKSPGLRNIVPMRISPIPSPRSACLCRLSVEPIESISPTPASTNSKSKSKVKSESKKLSSPRVKTVTVNVNKNERTVSVKAKPVSKDYIQDGRKNKVTVKNSSTLTQGLKPQEKPQGKMKSTNSTKKTKKKKTLSKEKAKDYIDSPDLSKIKSHKKKHLLDLPSSQTTRGNDPKSVTDSSTSSKPSVTTDDRMDVTPDVVINITVESDSEDISTSQRQVDNEDVNEEINSDIKDLSEDEVIVLGRVTLLISPDPELKEPVDDIIRCDPITDEEMQCVHASTMETMINHDQDQSIVLPWEQYLSASVGPENVTLSTPESSAVSNGPENEVLAMSDYSVESPSPRDGVLSTSESSGDSSYEKGLYSYLSEKLRLSEKENCRSEKMGFHSTDEQNDLCSNYSNKPDSPYFQKKLTKLSAKSKNSRPSLGLLSNNNSMNQPLDVVFEEEHELDETTKDYCTVIGNERREYKGYSSIIGDEWREGKDHYLVVDDMRRELDDATVDYTTAHSHHRYGKDNLYEDLYGIDEVDGGEDEVFLSVDEDKDGDEVEDTLGKDCVDGREKSSLIHTNNEEEEFVIHDKEEFVIHEEEEFVILDKDISTSQEYITDDDLSLNSNDVEEIIVKSFSGDLFSTKDKFDKCMEVEAEAEIFKSCIDEEHSSSREDKYVACSMMAESETFKSSSVEEDSSSNKDKDTECKIVKAESEVYQSYSKGDDSSSSEEKYDDCNIIKTESETFKSYSDEDNFSSSEEKYDDCDIVKSELETFKSCSDEDNSSSSEEKYDDCNIVKTKPKTFKSYSNEDNSSSSEEKYDDCNVVKTKPETFKSYSNEDNSLSSEEMRDDYNVVKTKSKTFKSYSNANNSSSSEEKYDDCDVVKTKPKIFKLCSNVDTSSSSEEMCDDYNIIKTERQIFKSCNDEDNSSSTQEKHDDCNAAKVDLELSKPYSDDDDPSVSEEKYDDCNMVKTDLEAFRAYRGEDTSSSSKEKHDDSNTVDAEPEVLKSNIDDDDFSPSAEKCDDFNTKSHQDRYHECRVREVQYETDDSHNDEDIQYPTEDTYNEDNVNKERFQLEAIKSCSEGMDSLSKEDKPDEDNIEKAHPEAIKSYSDENDSSHTKDKHSNGNVEGANAQSDKRDSTFRDNTYNEVGVKVVQPEACTHENDASSSIEKYDECKMEEADADAFKSHSDESDSSSSNENYDEYDAEEEELERLRSYSDDNDSSSSEDVYGEAKLESFKSFSGDDELLSDKYVHDQCIRAETEPETSRSYGNDIDLPSNKHMYDECGGDMPNPETINHNNDEDHPFSNNDKYGDNADLNILRSPSNPDCSSSTRDECNEFSRKESELETFQSNSDKDESFPNKDRNNECNVEGDDLEKSKSQCGENNLITNGFGVEQSHPVIPQLEADVDISFSNQDQCNENNVEDVNPESSKPCNDGYKVSNSMNRNDGYTINEAETVVSLFAKENDCYECPIPEAIPYENNVKRIFNEKDVLLRNLHAADDSFSADDSLDKREKDDSSDSIDDTASIDISTHSNVDEEVKVALLMSQHEEVTEDRKPYRKVLEQLKRDSSHESAEFQRGTMNDRASMTSSFHHNNSSLRQSSGSPDLRSYWYNNTYESHNNSTQVEKDGGEPYKVVLGEVPPDRYVLCKNITQVTNDDVFNQSSVVQYPDDDKDLSISDMSVGSVAKDDLNVSAALAESTRIIDNVKLHQSSNQGNQFMAVSEAIKTNVVDDSISDNAINGQVIQHYNRNDDVIHDVIDGPVEEISSAGHKREMIDSEITSQFSPEIVDGDSLSWCDDPGIINSINGAEGDLSKQQMLLTSSVRATTFIDTVADANVIDTIAGAEVLDIADIAEYYIDDSLGNYSNIIAEDNTAENILQAIDNEKSSMSPTKMNQQCLNSLVQVSKLFADSPPKVSQSFPASQTEISQSFSKSQMPAVQQFSDPPMQTMEPVSDPLSSFIIDDESIPTTADVLHLWPQQNHEFIEDESQLFESVDEAFVTAREIIELSTTNEELLVEDGERSVDCSTTRIEYEPSPCDETSLRSRNPKAYEFTANESYQQYLYQEESTMKGDRSQQESMDKQQEAIEEVQQKIEAITLLEVPDEDCKRTSEQFKEMEEKADVRDITERNAHSDIFNQQKHNSDVDSDTYEDDDKKSNSVNPVEQLSPFTDNLSLNRCTLVHTASTHPASSSPSSSERNHIVDTNTSLTDQPFSFTTEHVESEMGEHGMIHPLEEVSHQFSDFEESFVANEHGVPNQQLHTAVDITIPLNGHHTTARDYNSDINNLANINHGDEVIDKETLEEDSNDTEEYASSVDEIGNSSSDDISVVSEYSGSNGLTSSPDMMEEQLLLKSEDDEEHKEDSENLAENKSLDKERKEKERENREILKDNKTERKEEEKEEEEEEELESSGSWDDVINACADTSSSESIHFNNEEYLNSPSSSEDEHRVKNSLTLEDPILKTQCNDSTTPTATTITVSMTTTAMPSVSITTITTTSAETTTKTTPNISATSDEHLNNDNDNDVDNSSEVVDDSSDSVSDNCSDCSTNGSHIAEITEDSSKEEESSGNVETDDGVTCSSSGDDVADTSHCDLN